MKMVPEAVYGLFNEKGHFESQPKNLFRSIFVRIGKPYGSFHFVAATQKNGNQQKISQKMK